MKKAGELLGAFFDEKIVRAAKGYSEVFSSWRLIVGEKISAHSSIVEIERSIVIVEADHPGWIQILQTRQSDILEKIRQRFPEISVSGISFRLARTETNDRQLSDIIVIPEEKDDNDSVIDAGNPYDKITDDSFKSLLKRLEEGIKAKNRPR